MNIFRHAGKPAIIVQKLRRVARNKLHMKPRHNGREYNQILLSDED